MKKIKLFSLFAFGLLTLNSCKKEGCIDPDAVNYSTEAKKSDGSCNYESKVTFWFDQQTADYLYNTDVSDYVSITINGVFVGNYSTTTYFTAAPACEQAGAFSYTLDMGANSSSPLTYDIWNEWDDINWNKTIQAQGNNCYIEQIDI